MRIPKSELEVHIRTEPSVLATAAIMEPMAQKTPAQEFAARLHAAIDKSPTAPKTRRGRAQWLKKFAGRKLKVTDRAINKWLDGIVIPDRPNLVIVADLLGVSPSWLHYEAGEMVESIASAPPETYSRSAATGSIEFQPVPIDSAGRNEYLARIVDGFDDLPEEYQLEVLSAFLKARKKVEEERAKQVEGGRGRNRIIEE